MTSTILSPTTFSAVAETGHQSLTGALGINWTTMLIQAVAFLILVGILAKYVYPTLVRSIDSRRQAIEAGLAEAKKSQEASRQAEERIDSLLADARKEADDIIARGHTESNAMVAEAEDKAKQRAEQIITEARAQLDADVAKARAVLKKDTMHLVALATEKVVHEKLDTAKDNQLVERTITAEERL